MALPACVGLLTPGTYAMLCFVSKVTIMDKAFSSGLPHHMHGMVFMFTVA